jgi:hypothetical protein
MAELRAQTAELTVEKAAYAGRASCLRRAAWHVLYKRRAHLRHATRQEKTTPVIVRVCICLAARLSCQLALLGLAERAQHARATQQ